MDHKSKHKLPYWHFAVSLKKVLTHPLYLLFFIAASLVFYLILIAFPAKTIPGNSFEFQLSLMRPTDHLLLALLSLITGLNLTFHLYLFKGRKENFSPVKTASDSIVGIFSGLTASVFGTATCGVCVATIFGYFGFGTVLFFSPGVFILSALLFSFHLSLSISSSAKLPMAAKTASSRTTNPRNSRKIIHYNEFDREES